MSWLGDSFSSITGQLSTFTKEVLYEGREEVSDHATELSLANRKVQDLESECNKLQMEVSRLRASNEDLEERCRASDLQASTFLQQSRDLRAQHKARQASEQNGEKGKSLEIRIEELESQLRDSGERHLQQVSALQDQQEERIRQLHDHYRSLPSDTIQQGSSLNYKEGYEVENGDVLSLRAQLSIVEKCLAESRQKTEEQAEQLREAQRNAQRTSRQLEKVRQEKTSVSQELTTLRESLATSDFQDKMQSSVLTSASKDELQTENDAFRFKIENLEQKLSERVQELSDLISEKEMLDTSLVELDGQHQEAMEQLLGLKQDLQKENKSLQNDLASLQEQNMCLQTEVETLTEQLLLKSSSHPVPSVDQVQDSEISISKNDGGSLSSILQSVSDISAENLALEERIEVLEEDHQHLEVELLKTEERKQLLETNLSQAKEEVERLKEKLTVAEHLQRTSVSELDSLRSSFQASQEECQLLRNKPQNINEEDLNVKLNAATEKYQTELDVLRKALALKDQEWECSTLEREHALKREFEIRLEEITLESKTENNNFEQQLEQKSAEINSLFVTLADKQSEMDTLKEVANERSDLEQALLKSKAERERLENELIQSYEDKRQLELQAAKHDSEEKQLLSRISELESIVLEKNASPDTTGSYFSEMSENPDLLVKLQRLSSENENLQNESDDLHVRLMETSGEKERLLVALEELTERNNDTQTKFEEQRIVMEALELRLEEVEKFHAQAMDKLEQELEAVKSEANDLKLKEGILVSTNQELQENCKDFNTVKTRLEELELLVKRIQSKSSMSASQQTDSEDFNHSVTVPENDKGQTLEDQVETANCKDSIDKDVCDLKNLLKKKDSEILTINSQLESLIMQSESSSNYTLSKESEITALKSQIKTLTEEQEDRSSKASLLEQVRKLGTEKEQLVVILNEKTRECGSLKAEVHKLVSFVSAEKQALSKLQQDNQELMRKQSPDTGMSREVIQNLSRIIKDKDIEIEALKQKVSTLVDIAQQEEPERGKVLAGLLEERESLSKQLKMYQADREQISLLLNHKHQESLRYHEEMQKMAVRLTTECQRYESLKEEHRSVSQLFEEKQKSLLNTQNEVISLKQRVSELERQHTDLREKYNGLVDNGPIKTQATAEESGGPSSADQDLLLSEKDQMIYDLGLTLRKREDDSLQKDQALGSLQKRLESVQFQYNETLSCLREMEGECDRLKQNLEQIKEEKSMLGETNRSFSMALQNAQTEQDAMRQKMGTLTQVMQTNLLNGNSSEVIDPSKDGQASLVASPKLLLKWGEDLETKLQSLSRERDQAQLALSQLRQEMADAAQEKQQLLKQNEKLHRELDRLRSHLLELQDNYTQEIMVAEEREKELRLRLSQAEDKASLSSSAIISASQEATLRVESLQSQLSRIVRQRDAYLEQISQLEDRVQQQSAANTNLQLALEHIQAAHQRELQERKQKESIELASSVELINQLKSALEHKEIQLSDTSEALAAASRLSEQLDRKEEAIGQLREEMSRVYNDNRKLSQELQQMQSHTEGKVDKMIMKSLVLNYFMALPAQKPEMVRLLARILDFNQAEMEKAGLKMVTASNTLWPGGGWLTNFIHRTPSTDSPSHSRNAVATTSHTNQTQPSFSALFVQFLETESRPQAHLHLPIEQMTEGIVNTRGTRPDLFPRTQLTPIKTITTTTTSTTTVLAEHPLMRPISTALPTFTPVITDEDETKNSIVFLKDALQ